MILITGDIAESKDVCEILQEFSPYINKPIYFVLGNHDYYFSSVKNVREKVRALCAQNKNLVWLGEPKTVTLADGIMLVGMMAGQMHVMGILSIA